MKRGVKPLGELIRSDGADLQPDLKRDEDSVLITQRVITPGFKLQSFMGNGLHAPESLHDVYQVTSTFVSGLCFLQLEQNELTAEDNDFIHSFIHFSQSQLPAPLLFFTLHSPSTGGQSLSLWGF